jgi:hypothetical protein
MKLVYKISNSNIVPYIDSIEQVKYPGDWYSHSGFDGH